MQTFNSSISKSNASLKVSEIESKTLSECVFTFFGAFIFFCIGYLIFSQLDQVTINSTNGIVSLYTISPRITIPMPLFFLIIVVWTVLGAMSGLLIARSETIQKSSIVHLISRYFIYFLGALVVISLCLIASYKDPSLMVTDYFHDGERLGFFNLITQPQDLFKTAVFIHGPSNNVLPIALAEILFGAKTIVGFRLVIIAQQFLTYLSIFWLLNSVFKTMQFGKWHNAITLLFFSIIVLAGQPFMVPSPKDLLFFVSVSSVFAFISNFSSRYVFILGIIAGLTMVLSFFYTMNRATYGLLFFCLITFLFFVKNRNFFIVWISSVATGIITAGVCVIGFFGMSTIFDLIDLYSYWVVNARSIWGKAASAIESPQTLMAWLSLFLLIFIGLVSAFAVIILCLGTGKRKINSEQSMMLLSLLMLSPMFANDFINRFYFGKVTTSAFPVMLMAMILVAFNLKYIKLITYDKVRSTWLLFSILLLLAITLNTRSLNIVSKYIAALDLENEQLIEPDYIAATKELKKLTKDEDCFYTMTSEGFWYYILNKKSCSRFPILTYARSYDAQNEVVKDLQELAPRYILFSNRGWSNEIDGVSVSQSNSHVVNFVKKNYELYKNVSGHLIYAKKNAS